MNDPFIQVLHEWQTFYFMVGGASATLIGLMFVAVSLGADLPAAVNESGIRTFVTPMLIHFGSVLLISALMLIPTFRQVSLGVTLLLVGAVFTGYSLWIRLQFVRHPNGSDYSHSDWKWYVYAPIIGDVLAMLTGVGLIIGSIDAINLLVVAVAILLIVSVRNTWDLVLWIAQDRQRAKDESTLAS